MLFDKRAVPNLTSTNPISKTRKQNIREAEPYTFLPLDQAT